MDYSGLRICGIDYESFADGEGVRTVIFFSGCSHHCPGCHNAEAQDVWYGKLVTDEMIEEINNEIEKRPFVSGLTFSGGEPFDSASSVRQVLQHLIVPTNNLWIYTGYTYEQLIGDKSIHVQRLLRDADILVDGLFEQSKADKRLLFRGSSNQRIIDVKKSLDAGYACIYLE